MRVLTFLGVFLATACSHTPNHIPYMAEDGRPGWSTQCNNADQSMYNCIQSARIICGGEFVEIARHEEMGNTGGFLGFGNSTYPIRWLEYACVDPAKNPPR